MRKLVTIEKIMEKKSIEGADRIEAVRVRDWWVVAEKNQFNIGDYCVYFEIDSFLPPTAQFAFLLKGSNLKKMILDGKEIEGIRLKTIRLKGQISQGLVMPINNDLSKLEAGEDVSEYFGVIKYEEPIPAELHGKVKGTFPGFIPKTDEERIQNMAGVLSAYYVSEKIDGTSVTFYKHEGSFGVCSRNLELEDGNSTQWNIARKYDLLNKLPDEMAIQCELIGEGIQGNPLKQTGQDIYCFNVFNIKTGVYLNYEYFVEFCSSIGVKTVPIVDDNFSLPKTVDEILLLADGKSVLNQNEDREGIVIRPKVEMKYNGQRLSFKAISNAYLLKEK